MSRRQVLAGAGGTGLLAATVSPAKAATRARRSRAASDGTPEQVHLTWSENPATGVVVSWASPGQARRPRVRIGQRVIPAEPRPYTDGISGETVWTYHARVGGLRPGATYAYAVTADNDGNAADPFSATFRTAPAGRAPFRFTSFGDLATPNTAWVLSYGQSAYAVEAVESFQPLFHLLNGDLCYANLNPTAQPEVWRDFGNNNQTSAASRPWMPCLGNHEVEFYNGPQGFTSYLSRYTLPDNRVPGFGGRWYSFRVGSVAVRLARRRRRGLPGRGRVRGGPGGAGPGRGHRPSGDQAGHVVLPQGLLRRGADRLAGADAGGRPPGRDGGLDHRPDAPVRRLLLVHRQRLRPRHPPGVAAAVRPVPGGPGALRPRPRLRALLPGARRRHRRRPRGGHRGGGQHPAAAPGDDHRQRGVRHQPRHRAPHPRLRRHRRPAGRVRHRHRRRPAPGQGVHPADRPVATSTPGVFTRAAADAVEDAIWSARRDTATGYGIAVFDVDPGSGSGSDGQPSIKVTHYHAVGADPVNPATGDQGGTDPGLHRVRDLHPGPPRARYGTGSVAGAAGEHGIRSAHGRSRNRGRGRRPHHGDQPGRGRAQRDDQDGRAARADHVGGGRGGLGRGEGRPAGPGDRSGAGSGSRSCPSSPRNPAPGCGWRPAGRSPAPRSSRTTGPGS